MEERMNIVVVGHVDHGKSTLIGKLLVETNSLPEGKLDQVKKTCELNAKPFEYAFLLDALKDEQSQGITIDSARIFFNSKFREYIIIDAPGHIEFLKNMISGAARAEAAILLIDAKEGIAENSRRHGYMLSMLGIKQVVVAVNKMDLVDYNENIYNEIKRNYSEFLKEIDISPKAFIPISSREGINITSSSKFLSWYKGQTVIELIDSFQNSKTKDEKTTRMFLQDIYKFSNIGDDERLYSGTISTGTLSPGDEIVFYPSNKKNKIKQIHVFGKDNIHKAEAGEPIGLTLEEQVYLNPGELISKSEEKQPIVNCLFKSNIFWMGKNPLITGKTYLFKIGNNKVNASIHRIESVLNASNLVKDHDSKSVNRHEVASCIIETKLPIAFDLVGTINDTSRFVLVDDFDIAGCGIITENVEDSPNKISDEIHPFEIALHNLVKEHFPHWELAPLVKEN